jgi:undecaprenyl-diphosphatase
MRTRGHSSRAEAAMGALGTAGEHGAVWMAIALARAAADRRRRGQWLRAAPVAPAAVGVNYVVKIAVRRRRPRLRGLPPLAGAPSRLSFPSAHATSSIAAATAMARVSPRASPPLYGLAGAICATRPYLGLHYPSDVLVGAGLGLVIGRLWPGLGGMGAEERLIDLVSNAARSASSTPFDGRGTDGRRRPAAVQPSPGGDPLARGEPDRP